MKTKKELIAEIIGMLESTSTTVIDKKFRKAKIAELKKGKMTCAELSMEYKEAMETCCLECEAIFD